MFNLFDCFSAFAITAFNKRFLESSCFALKLNVASKLPHFDNLGMHGIEKDAEFSVEHAKEKGAGVPYNVYLSTS
jgi:hypothetical protein